MLKLFTIFLLLGQFAFSQQRYLVSPNCDAILLKKGESPTDIINKLNKTTLNKLGECPSSYTFGYPTTKYPASINHVMAHKDVLGQWFIAKASGTIDTIFWWGSSGNSAKDSLVLLRIFESNVGKDWGPGIPPYPAPCQSWGYWYNTNDKDQGVAAF
ncbi:MAG: hypothetical protein QME52_13295, partial [Bacteroidota bacterium]|nr:hypothetical protein [Bacteroidota bacterium]